MKLGWNIIIGGVGVIFVLTLLFSLRQRFMLLFVNRGISVIQRVALKGILSVNDGKEPRWVLVEYPTAERYSLGLLSQEGDKQGTIYLPSGPKLIPGQLIFLSNDKWQLLDLSFEEGLRVLVTMGLTEDSQQISDKIWNRMEANQS